MVTPKLSREDAGIADYQWIARWSPRIFCILATILGAVYGGLMPPMQIPDEWVHFARAYDISRGHCIAQPHMTLPASVLRLNDDYSPRLDQQRRFTLEEGLRQLRGSVDESSATPYTNVAANLYSCVPYLPAASAIRAGRLLRLSAGADMYLARGVNLIAYVSLTTLALTLLPDFQILLLCLALMPMTLHQAASLSADGMTIASSFLLCAYILKLAFGSQGQPLRPRDYAALAALMLFTSLCKFNFWIALLILLVPAARFGGARNRRLSVFAYFVLTCLAAILWQRLNWVNIRVYTEYNAGRFIFLADNLKFTYQHPGLFLRTLRNSLVVHKDFYIGSFIGNFGWLTVPLSSGSTKIYMCLLGLAALTQTCYIRIRWSQRLALLFFTLASVLSLFILLWCFSTTQADLRGPILTGQGVEHGMQGRYFIPLAFTGLLLLCNTRLRLKPRYGLAAAAGGAAYASYIAYGVIWAAFYGPGPR